MFWGLACLATALVALVYVRGWSLGQQALFVSMIYGIGAALAAWPAAYFARLFATKRSLWRQFLMLFFLAGFTTFLTACIFAIQHRFYYAQWHGDPFSRLWLWQQAFTGGAAVYTYVVLGLRLYVPAAVIALIVTSWWLNRLPD